MTKKSSNPTPPIRPDAPTTSPPKKGRSPEGEKIIFINSYLESSDHKKIMLDISDWTPEQCYYHSRDVLKDKFPEGEHIIATDYYYSYQYAEYVLKGKFPEGEYIIATDSWHSFKYAKNILKGRFPAGEDIIATDAFLQQKYKEFLESIESKKIMIDVSTWTPEQCYYHARDFIKDRFPEGESIIATDAFYSYHYAENVIKDRFELGEKIIATDAWCSYCYAKLVLKGRFELGEKTISKYYFYSYYYAKEILKGRFKLGEKAIATSSFHQQEYTAFLESLDEVNK